MRIKDEVEDGNSPYLPWYVRLAIKAAFPAVDALDFEACLEKRFLEKQEEVGTAEAISWLRLEAVTCLGLGCIRLAKLIFFWHWFM